MICPEFYVAEVIENTRNQDFMFEETFNFILCLRISNLLNIRRYSAEVQLNFEIPKFLTIIFFDRKFAIVNSIRRNQDQVP